MLMHANKEEASHMIIMNDMLLMSFPDCRNPRRRVDIL